MVAKAHQCNLSSACIKSYQTLPPVLKVFQGDIQSWEARAGFRFYENAPAYLMVKRFFKASLDYESHSGRQLNRHRFDILSHFIQLGKSERPFSWGGE